MTERPYRIVTDHDRRLITMSFDTILWDRDVSNTFVKDCIAAVMSLPCRPNEQLILVDLRNAVLQSQEVYERLLKLVAAAAARRIALVAAAPLARMQTKRLQIRDDVILFALLTDAEDWLFEEDREVALA